MPEAERRVIWGMMVGEEAKTKIPIYQNYTERGFDPEKHMLQSYGTGWQSANFLEQERQFFGAPGGIMHDWDLKTNIDGIYAAGDQLYASDCAGFACATGYYAGRKAAVWASGVDHGEISRADVEAEKARLYAPLYAEKENGIGWKELNMAIAKAMQNYCGGVKCEALLKEGLDLLESFERDIVPKLTASNPHDLMRTHEVLDILTVAQLVLHACLARKSSSVPLYFNRSDYPQQDPAEDRKHIVIRQENGVVMTRDVPLDFFGELQPEYEKRNQDYIRELKSAEESQNFIQKAEKAGEDQNFIRESEREQENRKIIPEQEKAETKHGASQKIEENPDAACAADDKSQKECAETLSVQKDEKQMRSVAGTEEKILTPEQDAVTFEVSPVPCSTSPLKYDESRCIGCNRCASVCQCDILLPSPEKGKHPIVMYPGECYYCGACVMVCPRPGALSLSHPLMNRAKFVPVKSGEEAE
jgi:NAD-dependent dihydropyrimidine dehydrogenase PreA subunit